jgi:hypothetical protein
MYKLPPDRRKTLSGMDLVIACVPYLNLVVVVSLLSRPESRKRGLQMLAISLIASGLYAAIWQLFFVGVLKDVPLLAWLDMLPWRSQLFLISIILALTFLALALRYIQSRRLARAWQTLAQRTGLDYKPGGCLGLSRRAEVTGHYRNRKLELYTYAPLFTDSVLDETRLVLSVANPLDLDIRLDYMPAWRVINTLLKTRDQVQIGDQAFDAAFTLTSKHPTLVSAVFAAPKLRQRFFRLREYTTLELKQTTLSLERAGRECNTDYLNFCLDLLSDLADAIEQSMKSRL